jgi:hypothetical protein
MAHTPVPIAGLGGLSSEEIIPFEEALEAIDCYVDDGTVAGRNGYRSLTDQAAVGSGVQGMWRFRPQKDVYTNDPCSCWIVVCQGYVYTVTDPTTTALSDGDSNYLGQPFGVNDIISATQLGRYMYLASDKGVWQRVKWESIGGWSLEEVVSLPQPPAPVLSSLSNPVGTKHLFDGGTFTMSYDTCDGALWGSTHWYEITDTAGTGGAPTGSTVTIEFQDPMNWTLTDWMCLFASPPDSSVNLKLKIEARSALTGAPWFEIGEYYDGTTGTSPPAFVFIPTDGIPNNSIEGFHRRRVNALRFTVLSTGGTAGYYALHGFMMCSTANEPQRVYYVSEKEWQTGVESPLSPKLPVAMRENAPVWSSFRAVTTDGNHLNDLGSQFLLPYDATAGNLSGNIQMGSAMPDQDAWAGYPTLAGTLPVGLRYPDADTLRLWRLMDDGIRLVKDIPIYSGATSYTIIDDGGDSTLANEAWESTGEPPNVSCLGAWGSQLIAGDVSPDGRRVHISSSVGFRNPDEGGETVTGSAPTILASDTELHTASPSGLVIGDMVSIAGAGAGGNALVTRITEQVTDGDFYVFHAATATVTSAVVTRVAAADPFPQWPEDTADEGFGSAFDVAPSEQEQMQAVSAGDAAYLLTDRAVRVLSDLDPGAIPAMVMNRGCISRRGFVFAEEALYWCAFDGIYTAVNRSSASELTKNIRRIITDWLKPDATTCMGYCGRKLYCFTGKNYVRLDMVTGAWTRGTVAHNVIGCASEESGPDRDLHIITDGGWVAGWRSDCHGDMEIVLDPNPDNRATPGTPIPDWVYSTGFDMPGVVARPTYLYANTSGPVEVSLYSSVSEPAQKVVAFLPGESEKPVPADCKARRWRLQATADNGTILHRLTWEREQLEGIHGA